MRIGIDIDNVISDFDKELGKKFRKHDLEINGIGKLLNRSFWRKEFFWSKSEEERYYREIIAEVITKLKIKKGALKYVKKLKKQHEIYIVTGRNNGDYFDYENITINWLSRKGVPYDEIIFTNGYKPKEKAIVCSKNNINIMIDDSADVCRECSRAQIKTVLFKESKKNRCGNFIQIANWKKIYKYIKQIN